MSDDSMQYVPDDALRAGSKEHLEIVHDVEEAADTAASDAGAE